MPLFLDRYDIPGVTAVDLATAHARDVQIEKQYGVRYITYWFDPTAGRLSAWRRALMPLPWRRFTVTRMD